MAIDTRQKRQSCIGVGLLSLTAGITPDGADLEIGQRQQATWLYASAATVEPAFVDTVELELCLLQTYSPELNFHRIESWTSEF